VFKLADLFRGIASCKIGDGTTVLFGSDVWNDHLLQQKSPRLFCFAKNKNIYVAQFLLNNLLETSRISTVATAYSAASSLREH
jgi:hypothetical protein